MSNAGALKAMPEMAGLTFSTEGHAYKLNGIDIPSVSSIIEPLSKAKYDGVDSTSLHRAAERGTSVHNAIENWIKFEIEDIGAQNKAYFDAAMDWWKAHEIAVVGSENRLYHKIMMYGGTADLIAYIDGKLTLVDYKTTYIVSDLTCRPQLEAYAQAAASHGIHVERKMILQLKKDGSYREVEYPARDAEAWRVFSSLKIVYDYLQTNK